MVCSSFPGCIGRSLSRQTISVIIFGVVVATVGFVGVLFDFLIRATTGLLFHFWFSGILNMDFE